MKTRREKQIERLSKFKDDNGLTYPELKVILGMKDEQYAYALVKGKKRSLSKPAAKKLEEYTGVLAAYWRGEVDYKTEEEFRQNYSDLQLEKEEAYIKAWNALLHEIAEHGKYDFSFVQDAPDYELMCKFSSVQISFEDFRSEMLQYSIDRLIEKQNKKENNNG